MDSRSSSCISVLAGIDPGTLRAEAQLSTSEPSRQIWEEDFPLPHIETEGLLVSPSCLSVVKATEPSLSEVSG